MILKLLLNVQAIAYQAHITSVAIMFSYAPIVFHGGSGRGQSIIRLLVRYLLEMILILMKMVMTAP